MTKFITKFKNLKKEHQDKIIQKLQSAEIEVIEEDKKMTFIVAQQIVSYNKGMRTPTFEKTVLDFIKEQKEYNKRNDQFQAYVLNFIKEQKEYNKRNDEFQKYVLDFIKEQKAINKRNNLK